MAPLQINYPYGKHPVHLRTAMVLEADTRATFTGACGIVVNEMLIQTDLPATIMTNRKATVVPAEPLGQLFAVGWGRLPVELKTHILSFNLVSDSPITSDTWEYKENLFTALRTTSEIAALALEVYYTLNTFLLRLGVHGMFPPRKVRHLVRRVIIVMGLTDIDTLDIMAGGMISLSTERRFGFSNLQQIHIALLVYHWHSVSMLRHWVSLKFGCSGQLYVLNAGVSNEEIVGTAPESKGEKRMRELKAALTNFIQFQKAAEPLDETFVKTLRKRREIEHVPVGFTLPNNFMYKTTECFTCAGYTFLFFSTAAWLVVRQNNCRVGSIRSAGI